MPRPAALYNRRKWQLIGKSQWCCSANCGHPLHALTYNWTRGMQLANTPPLQSTAPGLHPVSYHQMAPPVRGNTHPITAYYSVYRPRKDERLGRPGWLVTYRNKVPPPGVEPRHVTHPSTNRARRRVTSLIRPTPLPYAMPPTDYARPPTITGKRQKTVLNMTFEVTVCHRLENGVSNRRRANQSGSNQTQHCDKGHWEP